MNRQVSGQLKAVGIAVAALSLGAGTQAFAQEDLDALARRLITLRGEVEKIHDDIEAERRKHTNEMLSLTQRRSDLESQLQRQRLEVERIQRRFRELDQQKAKAEQSSQALGPIVDAVVSNLETYIASGLPFKSGERTAELKGLQSKLAKNEMTTPRALNRLWSFVEDELRLARENGLFSQVILIDGSEKLADVIRIGMVMLFYRTSDGQVGYAKRQGDSWAFQTESGPQAELIAQLFEAFERQIRTGFFRVPNPLSEARP